VTISITLNSHTTRPSCVRRKTRSPPVFVGRGSLTGAGAGVVAADWGVSVNGVLPGWGIYEARSMAKPSNSKRMHTQVDLGKSAVRQVVQLSGWGITSESKATRVGLNRLLLPFFAGVAGCVEFGNHARPSGLKRAGQRASARIAVAATTKALGDRGDIH